MREKTRGQDTERLLRAIAGGHEPWSGFSSDYWRSRPDAEQAPLPTKEVGEKHVNGKLRFAELVGYVDFQQHTFICSMPFFPSTRKPVSVRCTSDNIPSTRRRALRGMHRSISC